MILTDSPACESHLTESTAASAEQSGGEEDGLGDKGLFQPYFLVFCDAYVITLCSIYMPFCPDRKAVAFQQAGIQRKGTWTDGISCRLAMDGQ